MNENDLLKGGRASAPPDGTEAGLVSHVAFHERHPSSGLLALGKNDWMSGEIFGRVPEDWEEEDDESDPLLLLPS